MLDHLPELPMEVWNLILGHLSKTDLRAFASVSKECQRLAQYATLVPSGEYLVSLSYEELLNTPGAEQYIQRLTERALALGLPDLQSVFHLNDDQSSHLEGITIDDEGFTKGYNTIKAAPRLDIRCVWGRNRKAHRNDDQPAITHASGTREWYQHGLRQRDGDQPAIIYASGTREWYQHGLRHRDGDGPAIIRTDGTQEWYQHGQHHRDGDGPAIIRTDGTQEWYQCGKIHRDGDRPALILPGGTQQWYQRDQLHRDGDGPAIIRADGTQEWFRHGQPCRRPVNSSLRLPSRMDGLGLESRLI